MIERLNNAFFGAVDFFLRDRRLFFTYITVGAIAALSEFALFNLFYGAMKMPLMVANLSAIGIVVVFGFLSHKRFSFRDRQAFHRQLPWYLLMFGVALALNNALIYLFIAVLGWWAPLSKLLQIGICFLWNFTFSRLVVFRHAGHHHH
jgi:putative flippase GtrA